MSYTYRNLGTPGCQGGRQFIQSGGKLVSVFPQHYTGCGTKSTYCGGSMQQSFWNPPPSGATKPIHGWGFYPSRTTVPGVAYFSPGNAGSTKHKPAPKKRKLRGGSLSPL